MRTLLSVSLLFVALLGSACVRNTCDAETTRDRCDGQVRWHCPPRGVDQFVSSRWVKEDCAASGRTCLNMEDGEAVCALSAAPHPACADGVMRACESPTRAVTCRGGHAIESEACLSCESTFAGTEPVIHCRGGLGTTCQSDADCLPSLGCHPERGFCLERGEQI